MYVPEAKTIVADSREFHVTGYIKSLIPECDNRPSVMARSHDKMYRQKICNPCNSQLKYLKSLLHKRQSAALENGNRQKVNGMRKSYLTKEELKANEHIEKITLLEARSLCQAPRSAKQFISDFEESCQTSNQKKFISDCLDLFKRRNADSFEVQMAVLSSVVGKLLRGRNHHYSRIIKRVAKMSKNWLGSSNYSKIQVIIIK